MNLHEYQSKQLFAEYHIPVPKGLPAKTAEDAAQAAHQLGGELWVVKAQVHAGGRGKAGGVKLCRTVDEVKEAATQMLGQRLVTPQTVAEGLPINVVFVEEGSDIDRELYFSMLVDRDARRVVMMVSSAGGMNIEEVAEKTPEKIMTVEINPATGLMPYQSRLMAFALQL
ncbi:MAG: succinate--CoA ligase subunit beta, partial [Gammaproteobacteria bacterium]|nr:succinate--CoA ligase subunit beta [Gammaproteobacteria bacterium]